MLPTIGPMEVEEIGRIAQWMREDIDGVILEGAMLVTGVEELAMLLTSVLETCPRMSKTGYLAGIILPRL